MSQVEPKTVFVRNIGYHTESKVIAEGFSKFGPVQGVRILTEPFRGQRVSRGAGFVEFRTEEACQSALACKEPIVVDGRTLTVFPARPRVQHKRDTIFVRGMPEGVTAEQVKEIFAKYHPTEVRLVRHDSGDRKGFAFVQLQTEEDRTLAVKECPEVQLGGGKSVVKTAYPPRRRSFRGRRFNRRRAPRRAPKGDAPKKE